MTITSENGVTVLRLKCGITIQIQGVEQSLFLCPTATEKYGPKPMLITTREGKLFYGGVDIRLATLERIQRQKDKHRKEQTA